jgi:hypothetical protein
MGRKASRWGARAALAYQYQPPPLILSIAKKPMTFFLSLVDKLIVPFSLPVTFGYLLNTNQVAKIFAEAHEV